MEELNELKAKKEKAQGLLIKYKTQLEAVVSEREALVKKLQDEFGTTVEGAETKLAELRQKRDELLAEAKDALEKIKL